MFSINFYICLVVCIHGSTMSNEDIERHGLTRRRSRAKSSSKLLKSAATEKQSFLSWELEVFWEIVMAIVMFDPLGWFSLGLYELLSDWRMKTCFEYVFQWQFLQVSWPSDGMKRPKSSGFHLIWTKCQKPLHVTGLFLNQN